MKNDVHEYPATSFVAKHPALLRSGHRRSPHTRSLCGSGDPPNSVPTETHLLCDPQPQTDQIGIIHNVPVGERGPFGASRRPLKDTGHNATMPPSPRVSYVRSLGQFPSTPFSLQTWETLFSSSTAF